MELTEFIQHFADLFEDTDVSEIHSSTIFKNIEEWDSLLALSLIGMVDEEYDVRIKGEDIKSISTVEELYNFITVRK